MKLYSYTRNLPVLQSGEIAAVIFGALSDDDLHSFMEASPGPVMLMEEYKDGFVLSPAAEPINGDYALSPVEIEIPPSGGMLFWSYDFHHLARLQELAIGLNARFKVNRFHAGCGDLTTMLCKFVGLFAEDTQTYATRSAQLNGALAQLRREHEQTRKVLQSMQDVLWNIRGAPPRMTFIAKLGQGRLDAGFLERYDTNNFVQKLLVPTRGLAGIDIFVVEGCDSPGMMVFELSVTSTGEKLAEWHVEYSEAAPGWLHLPLSTIVSVNDPGAELRVTFVGPYSESPFLGLTDEIIIPPAYLAYGGTVPSDQMLCLRTWGGFPGIRNEAEASHLVNADNSRFFEYKLPPSTLALAMPCREYKAGFPCVVFQTSGELLVHPLFNTMVSAYVPGALPRWFKKIEAEVMVNGACMSKAEFAIAALPAGINPENVTPESVECLGSSGWIQISKNFCHELVGFSLCEPYTKGNLDLYLFTRVPDGKSVDYCQAQFVSVKVGMEISKAHTVLEAPSALAYWKEDEAISAPVEYRSLPASKLDQARPLQSYELDFTPFLVVPDAGVMIHPIEGSRNLVMIPKAVPIGATAVLANIRVGENCVSNVEFGLAVPIDDASLQHLDAVEIDGHSGFVAVTKEIGVSRLNGTVTLPLYHGLDREKDLYLYTRLPEGQSMNFADSYFESIRFAMTSESTSAPLESIREDVSLMS